VLARADMTASINDAADVVLVVEVVSPGNAAVDRILERRPQSTAENASSTTARACRVTRRYSSMHAPGSSSG
jgi:hypothetical protein